VFCELCDTNDLTDDEGRRLGNSRIQTIRRWQHWTDGLHQRKIARYRLTTFIVCHALSSIIRTCYSSHKFSNRWTLQILNILQKVISWKLVSVAIANALQLKVAWRHASPFYDAHAKFEVAQPDRCRIMTFLLLIRYVSLWPNIQIKILWSTCILNNTVRNQTKLP